MLRAATACEKGEAMVFCFSLVGSLLHVTLGEDAEFLSQIPAALAGA